eukprot:UN27101
MSQNQQIFVFSSSSIGKMEANKMPSLFQPIEFLISKFDRSSYQTSKATFR